MHTFYSYKNYSTDPLNQFKKRKARSNHVKSGLVKSNPVKSLTYQNQTKLNQKKQIYNKY